MYIFTAPDSNLQKKKLSTTSIVSLALSLLFYLFFALYDGPILYPDSDGYIQMSFSREPVYPLLLALLRFCSPGFYLNLTVILQSLLMAVSGWALADYLSGRFNMNLLFSSFLYLLTPAVSLLCRFAAGRKAMYTNSILTEGIAFPLYLLFILFLYRYMLENNHRKLFFFFSCFLAFLLISTRKQMMFVILLLLLAVFFKRKASLRSLCFGLLISFMLLFANRLLDCGYNYVLRGQFTVHSSSNRFLTTMLFYNAKESDADYITDSNIRELFLSIYYVCDTNGYLASHANDGWLAEVNHFGDHYDHIQIDTMWPMILDYSRATLNTQDIALLDLETDRINSEIITALLPHHLTRILGTLINSFFAGLVSTVAQVKPVFLVYSVFIYLLCLFLWVRLFLIYQKSPRKSKSHYHALLFGAITAFAIVINVALVSCLIFCQTRYTIYNMPLFYLAGTTLLWENAKSFKKHNYSEPQP